MYRQVFVPNAQNSSIIIPRKWYGTEVEVLVFPIGDKEKLHAVETIEEEPKIDYRDIKQVIANINPEKKKRLDEIFDKHLVSMKDFKFDRNEANNYD